MVAQRWLFSDVGTIRSLPWKAPGKTCSYGDASLGQALGVGDVFVYEQVQFTHDDEGGG